MILMRSPGSRSAAFAQALAERNVPCSFEESGDFYQTPEISVTLALLEIVDNPRQDVPLIAVLRSPLFGFSADRLALIRALQPEGDYYDALCLDDGAEVPVGPGLCHYCPRGRSHSVVNTGTEPLVILGIVPNAK